MRKRLTIAAALVFLLGAAGNSAVAADNPLRDVPAQHWAYASLDRLVDAGIIDGYQGKYNGGRTLTRYEMAKVVAKAMGKMERRQDVDAMTRDAVEALSVEFSDELNNNFLIRLDALEDKADKIRMKGSYLRTKWDVHKLKKDGKQVLSEHASSYYRMHLGFEGNINRDWDWVLGLRQDISWYESGSNANTNNMFNRGYLTGKVGDFYVDIGRQYHLALDGTLWESYFDGVKVSYGQKWKTTAYLGYHKTNSQVVFYDNTDNAARRQGSYIMARNKSAGKEAYNGSSDTGFYGLESRYAFSKQTQLAGGYYVLKGKDLEPVVFSGETIPISTNKAKMWEIMLTQALGGDFAFEETYTRSDARTDNRAHTLTLQYKKANRRKPGSYGAQVQYRSVDRFAQWSGVYDCNVIEFDTPQTYTHNTRIWDFEYDYVPWKNTLWKTKYSYAKSADHTNLKDTMLITYMNYY